jgi:hypothetical protein
MNAGATSHRVGCLIAAFAILDCALSPPPFTKSEALSPVIAGSSTVVFEWRITSCDSPGHYVLMSGDGRFIGTVARGTKLLASLPPGLTEIIAWNPVMEEQSSPPEDTAVLTRFYLEQASTHHVALTFGEWDARGPRRAFRGQRGGTTSSQVCVNDLAVLIPAVEGTPGESSSGSELPAFVADRDAGQLWLENSGKVDKHRARALAWFSRLSPRAKEVVAPSTIR